MKKKTAVVFGTFAPLHQGHIDLIQRAKRQCDQVWVVLWCEACRLSHVVVANRRLWASGQ